MTKRLYRLIVRGKLHEWAFDIRGDPKYLREWLDDGLDVNIVLNEIPFWVMQLGLTKLWCWLQDNGIIPL